MSEDVKETKAKKLAAARKKLKEYQRRGLDSSTTTPPLSIASECLSERSNSEINLSVANENSISIENSAIESYFLSPNENMSGNDYIAQQKQEMSQQNPVVMSTTVESTSLEASQNSSISPPSLNIVDYQLQQQQQQQFNAMQLLINEKTQLLSELNKCRNLCHEKDFELNEIRSQLVKTNQCLEELRANCKQNQQTQDQLRKMNAELMHKLSQSNAAQEDQTAHLKEIQDQLRLAQNQTKTLEETYKAKSKDLELAQLRIQQLSDDNSTGKDNRVDVLTQNQYMYEQQIRDLQAMVQQFTQDKEQSSVQYQNYVEHLNAERNSLTERNSELTDECTRLQERERQLIEHVSELEKEIQKNINLRQSSTQVQQDQQDDSQEQLVFHEDLKASHKKIEELQERINDFDFERHEFQLKIKSQEDHLIELQRTLEEKEKKLLSITEHVAEQPDQAKLLAIMESDKVAASRALSQNIELKKQLNEMEMRFVQLTNDKANLIIKLDAEEFGNREMRNNFNAMETRLNELDERFKYKDAEMIRLSHENEELIRENSILKQALQEKNIKAEDKENKEIYEHVHKHHEHSHKRHEHDHNNHENEHKHHEHGHKHHEHDHEHHEHDREHHEHDHEHHEHDHEHHEHDHEHHEHDHKHHEYDHKHHENDNKNDHHSHDREHHSHDDELQNHVHDNKNESNCYYYEGKDNYDSIITEDKEKKYTKSDSCHEAVEIMETKSPSTPHIPTAEAVEKLQARFTYLMSQIANLTEDKQHLEHLVLQLQGETETIGEYIALYQTQRRILKQREYEKAAQTRLLQEEREVLREKIAQLNYLVSKLGCIEMPLTQPTIKDNTKSDDIRSQLNNALAESISIEPSDNHENNNCTDENKEFCNDDEAKIALLSNPSIVKKHLPTETSEILTKIQNIVSEIKEDTSKDVTSDEGFNKPTDICHCCEGQLKVI